MAYPPNVKRIIDNWISRATGEVDQFDAFICYWIAFNCYYLSATHERADRDAIEAMKVDADILKHYATMKDSAILEAFKNISPVINVQRGGEHHINKEDFPTVLEALYQIRNNLFHGSKGDDDKRDQEVIAAAVPVLKSLVEFCQSNYNNLKL